jgi:hypothetical protein
MRRLKPLTLDTLFEKQAIPFERKGSRPDTDSFIVGGAKPKRGESPQGTMNRTEKKFGNTPRVKSAREAFKNKSDQNYRSDPGNR